MPRCYDTNIQHNNWCIYVFGGLAYGLVAVAAEAGIIETEELRWGDRAWHTGKDNSYRK